MFCFTADHHKDLFNAYSPDMSMAIVEREFLSSLVHELRV